MGEKWFLVKELDGPSLIYVRQKEHPTIRRYGANLPLANLGERRLPHPARYAFLPIEYVLQAAAF
jgi:hypothetical protein